MLKLGKQIGRTIYWLNFASNEAKGVEGVEYHIGGGVVQNICLVGYKIQPVDGYMGVCLVLTIDVYGLPQSNGYASAQHNAPLG